MRGRVSKEVSVGTDARMRQVTPVAALTHMSRWRHFFRTNEVPIYFVGATPFNC